MVEKINNSGFRVFNYHFSKFGSISNYVIHLINVKHPISIYDFHHAEITSEKRSLFRFSATSAILFVLGISICTYLGWILYTVLLIPVYYATFIVKYNFIYLSLFCSHSDVMIVLKKKDVRRARLFIKKLTLYKNNAANTTKII